MAEPGAAPPVLVSLVLAASGRTDCRNPCSVKIFAVGPHTGRFRNPWPPGAVCLPAEPIIPQEQTRHSHDADGVTDRWRPGRQVCQS